MWRALSTGLLVSAAVLVAAQVGLVRAPSKRSELEDLRQRLSSAQQRYRSETARAQRELERARVRADWLEVTLGQAQRENRELRDELDGARGAQAGLESSRMRLETEVERLERSLRDAPPYLDVEVAVSEGLAELVALAYNPGEHPVDISDIRARLWVDDLERPEGFAGVRGAVDPDSESELWAYALGGDEAQRVFNGDSRLRAALCFVYERATDRDLGAWADVYAFEYQSTSGEMAVVSRDSRPVGVDEIGCPDEELL